MRQVFVLCLLALSAGAFADNLINIPIGRKVPYGTIRFEGLFQQSDLKLFLGHIDYGIDSNFDSRLTYEDYQGSRRVVTGDFSYNYVTPITGISPGISIGMLDVANRTADGRRPYIVNTYRVGGADLFNPVELSFGVMYAGRPLGFVGLSFPFSEQLRVLAEDDGRRVNAGFEWRQNRSLAFRWIFQDSKPQLGVRYQTHL